MIITTTNVANNIYGLIGIGFGSLTGVAVAYITSKANSTKKENVEIQKLKHDLEDLSFKFDSLKTAFTLVFDEMDRKGQLPEQLKDFKKMFDL